MAFPTTPVHAANSTMTFPKTPVRAAASAMAVPTTPVIATTSTEDVVTPDAAAPSTPKSAKPARANITYNSLADDITPLIIASSDIKFNYKAMAALDPRNRTASALEHKVRGFRQAAKALVAAAEERQDDANDKAIKKTGENGIADSDADGPSVTKGRGSNNEKKSTPGRKGPVKASARGRKVAFAKDTMPSEQDESTPSKKTNVPRKRQVKVENANENSPAKKRKTTKKGQKEANEDELGD